MKLDVITVADTHGNLLLETLEGIDTGKRPDVIFMLGDLSYWDLDLVLSYFKDTKVYSVLGNHDSVKLLDEVKETYPELNDAEYPFMIKGFSCAGLSGAVKYKDDPYYCLITQKESAERLNPLGYVDILLTHDKPMFEEPEDFDEKISHNAHSGLYGIGKYIKEKQPKYVLHGHIHIPSVNTYGNTTIRCCYGVERFELEV